MVWRQTVLPLAGRSGSALTQWPAAAFGAGLPLAVDYDKIEALSGDRAALCERVAKALFLTTNEKRAAAGFGAIEGGDTFQADCRLRFKPSGCGNICASIASNRRAQTPR